MYDSNRFIDMQIYPERCPWCFRGRWLDLDWETGLGYCRFCGEYEEDEDE